MEPTLNGEKSNESKHIPVNNEQHKKSFRSSFPTLDRFE